MELNTAARATKFNLRKGDPTAKGGRSRRDEGDGTSPVPKDGSLSRGLGLDRLGKMRSRSKKWGRHSADPTVGVFGRFRAFSVPF